MNRLFTWGFGGYGRNGHNSGDDELVPRELTFFSKPNPSHQVRDIVAGGTFSCVITETRQLYFWGKLPNSPRGEAQTYPKLQPELFDWNIRCVGAGSQFIVVASADVCIGWGKPVGGKLGLEGDIASSVVPKYVDKVKFLTTIDISCGYGHCAFVVDASANEQAKATLEACPVLPEPNPMYFQAGGGEKRATGSGTIVAAFKKQKK